MRKSFSDEARTAAQEAYENEYETRWFQLSDGFQDELVQAAQDKIDLENPQYEPTKPTDAETKAAIRKVLIDATAGNSLTAHFTDKEYVVYIDNAVEEMFAIMKKSFS